jgi:hypothetical protein
MYLLRIIVQHAFSGTHLFPQVLGLQTSATTIPEE